MQTISLQFPGFKQIKSKCFFIKDAINLDWERLWLVPSFAWPACTNMHALKHKYRI